MRIIAVATSLSDRPVPSMTDLLSFATPGRVAADLLRIGLTVGATKTALGTLGAIDPATFPIGDRMDRWFPRHIISFSLLR